MLAGTAWLVAALAADTAGLAAGLGTASQVLGRLLIPVLGAGVVGQILARALTFLLPVTAGGGPAGNRRLTGILERGWRTRAILGNAGVLALITLTGGGWGRTAAWAAMLAGFGTFPVLAASRWRRREPAPAARAGAREVPSAGYRPPGDRRAGSLTGSPSNATVIATATTAHAASASHAS